MPEYPIHGSKYFDIREFVDERTWKTLGVNAQWLIDEKTVRVADLLRETLDSAVYINTWHLKLKGEKPYVASGFRAVWEKTGGKLSQHRCGRAEDVKSKKYSPAQIFAIIVQHKYDFWEAGLRAMEYLIDTPTWNHLDTRPTGLDDFLIVRP